MNFYNFFTNLNVSPSESTILINRISQILINSEGQHYSDLQNFSVGDNPNEILPSPNIIKRLNPTLFKTQDEKTLPVISFLLRESSPRTIYNSNQPWTQYTEQLNPTRSNQSRYYDNDTKLSYGVLFSRTNLGSNYRIFDNNHSAPNQTFLNLLKQFENTQKLFNQYSINSETHKAFLDDGYICWVDSIQHSSTLNNSENISPLRNIAKAYISTFNYILKIKNGTSDEVSDQDIGKRIWDKLLTIDNNRNFSHLDFDRPTQTLLLLEDETIKNYIDMFLSIKVFNYLKMNTLMDLSVTTASEEDDVTTIYSHFSKQFFDEFRKDFKNPEVINNSNLQILNSPPMQMQLAPSLSMQYNWEFSSLFDSNDSRVDVNTLPPKDNTKSYIPFGGTSGFLIHNDGQEKFSNLFVTNSIQENPSKRIKGLISNGFTKATTKQDFEFVSLTKKQSLIRKGFFIPVLLNFAIYNENCEFELAYNFCLLNYSDDLHQVKKRRRSRREFYQLYRKYGQDGLMLVNYEIFLKKQAESMKDLSEYSIVNSPTFGEFSQNELNHLINTLKTSKEKLNKKINYSIAKFSDNITSRLIVNPIIVKKYSKVNNSYTKLIEQNDKHKSTFATSALNLKQNQNRITNCATEIKRLKEQILAYQKELKANTDAIRESFNKRVDLVKTLCTNKGLYIKMNQRYNDAVESALKENKYASNSFFKNLYENEGIKILSILANDQNTHIQPNLSQEALNTFSSNIISKTKEFIIDEVEFLIDKPVKILVDGGSKGEVAAGPYIVKVNKNRMNIALAYPSSIHGFNNSNNQIYIHPHASSMSTRTLVNYFNDDMPRYSSGCLGEASALLYKAFENNDLKTIIMSALTWVKNANSADPWGRNYKFFPNYSEMIKGKPSLTKEDEQVVENEITEDEVEDFISAMIEETTPELLTQPIENLQEEIQPQEQETNVQETNGIEAFNTDETYIPYAQR